jgi:hypothetical protein
VIADFLRSAPADGLSSSHQSHDVSGQPV